MRMAKGVELSRVDTFLRSLHACAQARQWARQYQTMHEVWDNCERADWMLWLCAQMEGKPGWPDRKQIVLAACVCAERALRFVKEGEDTPRLAIEAARAWARDEVTLRQVQTAREATYAYARESGSSAAAAAGAAAASAASAAAAAAAAFAGFAVESDFTNTTASNSAYAAADAAYSRSSEIKIMADLIRPMLPIPAGVA